MVLLAANGFLNNPFTTKSDVEAGLVSREVPPRLLTYLLGC
jgi:hypothetical protein